MTPQPAPKQVITRAQWVAADAALREALSRFASQARFEEEFLRAFLIYWSAEDEEDLPIDLEHVDPDSEEFLLTFEWFVYDYRESESGKRIIDLFAEAEGPRLPALQRQLLEARRQQCIDLYEVHRIEDGRRYHVLRVMTGQEYAVDDEPSAGSLAPGDLLAVRLLPVGERWYPSTLFRSFSPADLPRLTATLRLSYEDFQQEHPGASWEEFLRENGFLFNDYTLERRALAEAWHERGTEPPAPADEEREPSARDRRRWETALRQAYEQWLERPSPALDMQTPLEAASDPQLRPRLKDILQQMEEIEASFAWAGEPALDWKAFIREKGLL
jgi:hypothetical protein